MEISLICGTINRSSELIPLLRSLQQQINAPAFELILVDQNSDDRVEKILNAYAGTLTVRHIKTKQRGLVTSRNLGIHQARGKIIAFPDDDCYYAPDTLATATTQCKDILGIGYYNSCPPHTLYFRNTQPHYLKKNEVFSLCSSISIFINSVLLKDIGLLDTNLDYGNPATPYGAMEDYEIVLRAMQKNYSVYYNPHIQVFHEINQGAYSEHRMLCSGFCYYYLLKKYFPAYKLWSLYFKECIIIVIYTLLQRKEPLRWHQNFMRGIRIGAQQN